ncbi:uncharacterized protein ACB058_015025 [Synchiropus picturatus]
MNTVTLKVEYYRSYEYQLKWPIMVNTRHSGKLKKTLKKTQRQPVNSEEGGAVDLSELIGGDQELLSVSDGVKQSDEDSRSSISSLASGPSRSYQDAAPYLCSTCLKLYERAKKMKRIKDKLLDNDPCSLLCDQWVLRKKWRVSRRPNTEGKLMQVVCRITIQLKKRRPEQSGRESDCSRPHPFLQRNLRVKPRFKKQRNKRKRLRQGGQGPRSAKQQRLHGNSRQRRPPSINSTQSNRTLDGNCSGFWDGDGDSVFAEESQLESEPIAVSMATHPNRDFTGKQEETLKQSGFRDLLAQLSNTSTIIRENRQRKYELLT